MYSYYFGLIQNLLEEKIGMDPVRLGAEVLKRSLFCRLRITKTKDLSDYYELLIKNPKEFQELIELLVVPETWFFREPEALYQIAKFANERIMKNQTIDLFKILCLPCSSGEEAFSLAMALDRAGISSSKYKIDAVDISKKALVKAETGVYGRNSFRGKSLDFREAYFQKKEYGYVVSDKLRKPINFIYHNVFSPSFSKKRELYPVILCRNLLIYLSPKGKKQLLDVLDKLLLPTGILVVGKVEADIVLSHGYVSVDEKKQIFQKMHSIAVTDNEVPIVKSESIFKSLQELAEKVPLEALSAKSGKKEIKQKTDNLPTLEAAIESANKGKLDEAEALGNEYLKNNHLDPCVYYLLGLISQARGIDEKAEHFFQKALYLKPDYYDVLVYLHLLYQKKGNPQQAKIYKTRAAKIKLSNRVKA